MRALWAAAFTVLAAASFPAAAAGQSAACATFEPSAAFRGEPVHVKFKAPPAAPPAGTAAPAPSTVTFRGPTSRTWSAPVTLEGTRPTFTVPNDIPLGDYKAEFSADCSVPFPVRSTVHLTMSGVTPAGALSAGDNDRNVTFAIQGSGFVTSAPGGDEPWTDNELFIDDELWKGVTWNPPGAPKCDDTTATSAQADVLDAGTIRICHLNLESFENKKGWLAYFGIKATTLRIAVGQPGVRRTDAWPFRLYPSWAGAVTVTEAAALVTFLLAGAVLYCVHRYKHSRTDATNQFSAWTALFLDVETETYSLSKLQFYLWTIASLFGYTYLVLSRLFVQGAEWPQVPDNLPGIVGIGVGTAVGAQVATNIRGPKGSGTQMPSLGDFVMSGGVVAADRVQMFVWTLLGVGFFIVSVTQNSPTEIVKLDSIPSSLLVLSGISSFGYLGGKLARKPGPVLDEIHIDPPDPDDVLARAAVPPPGTVDMTAALTQAQAAVLPAPAAVSAKAAVDALTDAKNAVAAIKSVAQASDALPALAAKRQIAEATASAAAEAMLKTDTPDAALAAETAQRAAAAVGDLESAVRAAAGAFANQPAGTPRFERVISLRGRNLSPNGLFSIDGLALPFRMLKPNPLDPAAKRAPEVEIAEVDNPEMAMALKLTIDPGQLAPPDRAAYDRWFAAGSDKPHVLKITNLDGQHDDLNFTMPPAAAQAPGKGAGNAGAQQGATP